MNNDRPIWLKWIGLILVVLSLGLTVYWVIWDKGPFKWMNDIQIKWFDGYYFMLSGLLTMLIAVGMAAGLLKLLELIFMRKEE